MITETHPTSSAEARPGTPPSEAGLSWQRRYERDGYFIIRKLFDPDRLARWNRRFEDICTGKVPAAPGMLVMRDVEVAKGRVQPASPLHAIAKLQTIRADPVLDEYVTDPGLLDHVERITGPDIKSVHTMLINKPPGVDGRHPLHQDLLYFRFRPADRIVGAWTAMETCNRANGCLVALPGSHKRPLLRHSAPDWDWLNHYYLGAEDVDPGDRVHLEMEAGDTIFFHPLLVHGSGRNRSDHFRRSISTHYASAACTFIAGGREVAEKYPYQLVRGRAFPDGI